MFRILAIAVAICALVPLNAAYARGPSFGFHQEDEPAVRKDLARIYFYRPRSMFGGTVQPYVLVDGYNVGVSRTGGYFYYDVAPGTHVVNAPTEVDEPISVTVTAGQTIFVRFHADFGVVEGHMIPELVTTEQGQSEIRACDFDGTDAPPKS
ncbi:MAG: DUF2846 domain-containing protein [Rhizomicrobium sp.]|jgi:hypothetical protein